MLIAHQLPHSFSTQTSEIIVKNKNLKRITEILHMIRNTPMILSRSPFSRAPKRFKKRLFSSDSPVKVIYESSSVVHVKLCNTAKLNALDMSMFESLAKVADSLRDDKNVRVVILSGEGRAFCSGLNIKSILRDIDTGLPSLKNIQKLLKVEIGEGSTIHTLDSDRSDDTMRLSAVGNLAQNIGYLWRQLPYPVIAVLHGCCFGGGMQIALGADFRFSTPDCKLSIMEAKWGLIPDMSGSITLRELIPIDVAKELAMTGRIISGTEASTIGLVTRCADDPMDEAIRVANEIIDRSPDSVAAAKKLFQETWMADEKACLKIETALQLQLMGSWNQLSASLRNFGLKLPYRKGSHRHIFNDDLSHLKDR